MRLRLAKLTDDGTGRDPKHQQGQSVEQHHLEKRPQRGLRPVTVNAMAHPDQELARQPFRGKARNQHADQQQGLAGIEAMPEGCEEAPDLRQFREGEIDPVGQQAQERAQPLASRRLGLGPGVAADQDQDGRRHCRFASHYFNRLRAPATVGQNAFPCQWLALAHRRPGEQRRRHQAKHRTAEMQPPPPLDQRAAVRPGFGRR